MTWLKRSRVRPEGKNQPSLANSMESLTQSQLNLAIMDMLNIGQNWNRCEDVCRGKGILVYTAKQCVEVRVFYTKHRTELGTGV